jgi:NAD(P)H-hydrate repair Nnr-like enzyme with NAD(P)H-hydrate epimerase domain
MRASTTLAVLLSLATVLIQNASGAAVMSIDVGSEWMKVGEYLMKQVRVSETITLSRSALCRPDSRWRLL